jgi:(2R)-3-sulfolactate dehydrogenase (NADP+)
MTSPTPAPELHELAHRVLIASGASPANAAPTADALIAAELDGIPSHGLSRLPFYADQIRSGKINGRAIPEVSKPAKAALRVDARNGLAFPAIALGLARGAALARDTGIVAIAIANSHHCGVAGHHVERLASEGLVALAFANTPAAIAPWGGRRALFGTNPIAFACPRKAAPPLVIDLSLSVAARGRIMLASSTGEAIPESWALDRDGRPTTDAKAALAGTMRPIGEAKGAALTLMVEILAAGLTGANFGFEASSFFEAEGPPPSVGQLFLVLDPAALAGPGFAERIEVLAAAMLADPGVRIPGARRFESRVRLGRDGIAVPPALLAELRRRAGA